jgi:phosphohistidine swiveling domain-containing protein
MSTSTTSTLAPGQPIPVPENFPVSWEHPEDADLTWRPDSHAIGPRTPLSFSVGKAIIEVGFNTAFPQLGLPIQFRVTYINGYPYSTAGPISPPSEGMVKIMGVVNRFAPGLSRLLSSRMSTEMTKQQLDKLNPILERLDLYWQDELLPEIERHFAFFESCDLCGLSQAQLRAYFVESLARAGKMGGLHALAGFPALAAMSMFEELFRELFPQDGPLEALRLLQGFDNQTMAGDRAMWQLSQLAKTMPSVKQALTELPAADVISHLNGSVEGLKFLGELRSYLRQYGQRLNSFGLLIEPSWIEDPTTVIDCLKAYLTQSEANPAAEQSRLEIEREKAITETRERLAGYPQPVVERFETLLKAAQIGVGIKEDNHWVIERLFYHMRRVALEFGRRLTESNVLAGAEDIFYLTADELLGEEGLVSKPLSEQINQRQVEREHFSLISPPPVLGRMPDFVPDEDSPYSKALGKADGAMQAPGFSDAMGLHGQPGSSGVVRGPARIIRTIGEANKLQSGEVLVAPATMPPWTPLFGIAVAVVTDSGGVLSHCAVVAREYGIPAVVGTGMATRIFQDGQMLEVNGDDGLVRDVSQH